MRRLLGSVIASLVFASAFAGAAVLPLQRAEAKPPFDQRAVMERVARQTTAARLGSNAPSEVARVRGRRVEPRAWRRAGEGAERNLGSGLRERVERHGRRLDWSLQIDHRSGDERGVKLSARTRPGAGLGTSDAVVHSGGRSLARLPAVSVNGTLQLRIPGRIAAKTESPLSVEISVSPEHPVSEPVTVDGLYSQQEPAV